MATTQFLTIDMITREALMQLENHLVFAKGVNRTYDSSFAKKGAKIGDTLRVRMPNKYYVTEGPNLQLQDYQENHINVKVDKQAHVDISFNSSDLALNMDDFSDRFIKPAILAIANKIDREGLELALQLSSAVGSMTDPTTPNLRTFLDAGALLMSNGAPNNAERSAVVSQWVEVNLVDTLKGLFQSATDIASQYKQGTMGFVGGSKFSMTQNVVSSTSGTYSGTPTLNGADQEGGILELKGFTAGDILKKGDTLTITGIKHVNPVSRQSSGFDKSFVVMEDVTASASGFMSVQISPAIVPPSGDIDKPNPYQNIETALINNMPILINAIGGLSGPANTTYTNNLVFLKDAFTLVTTDLLLPDGVHMASRMSDERAGISVRVVQNYDINKDSFPCRIDVLYGWSLLRDELAVRVRSLL